LPDFADSDLESLAILGSGISPRFIGKPLQLTGGKAGEPKPGAAAPGAPLPAQPSTTPPPPATRQSAESLPVPRLAFIKLAASPAEVNAGGKLTVAVGIENV